jgi:hypothetical protein
MTIPEAVMISWTDISSNFPASTAAPLRHRPGATKTVTTIASYTATINTSVDGLPAAAPGTVELRQSGSTVATAASSGTGVYTAAIPNGSYDIFINNADTETDITISGAPNSATVNYYTVSFSLTTPEQFPAAPYPPQREVRPSRAERLYRLGKRS